MKLKKLLIKDNMIVYFILGIVITCALTYWCYVDGDYVYAMINAFCLGSITTSFLSYIAVKKRSIRVDKELLDAIVELEGKIKTVKAMKPAESITCPKCKMTSYSSGDIEHKFCITCGYHIDL